MDAMKIGRNDPCPCGTGQKYKKCCAAKDAAARSAQFAAEQAELLATRKAQAEAQESAGEDGGESEPAATSARPKRPKLPTAHTTNRARIGT